MSGHRCQGDSPDPYAMLAERCDRMDLAVWRCNPAGVVLGEPRDEGLRGLWLNANPIRKAICRAIAEIAGQTPSEPIDLAPGCWMLAMPEIRRKRLGGYIVALALGPDLFDSELFRDACRSAQLDPAATRRCLRASAPFDKATARRVFDMMRWMVNDLQAIGDLDETVSGFTDQLGNAYETIDLLYALGHSMNEPNEPAQFIETALTRLHEAMDFAWLSALFVDDPARAPLVHDRLFTVGTPLMTEDALEQAIRSLVARLEDPSMRVILSDVEGFEPDGGPQVVVQPILRKGTVAGFLLAGDKGGSDPQVSSYDTHLLEATSGYIGPFLENVALYETQQQMFLGTLRALSSAIDAKDPYTCGHSERVAMLSARLAREMGLPEDQVERIHIAGVVHDVGKIGVPEAILCKKGRLTDEEFDAIKQHPGIGYNIIKEIPMLGDVLPGVLYHHERWDGRGYPQGLAGEDIPLMARIIGICDTFDAMSSNRSYRPALKREDVLAEIHRCAGSQFDPSLVEPFMRIDLSEYDEMVARSHAQEQKRAA